MIRIYDDYGDKYKIELPITVENDHNYYRVTQSKNYVIRDLSFDGTCGWIVQELAALLDIRVTDLQLNSAGMTFTATCERGERQLGSIGYFDVPRTLEDFALFVYKSLIECWMPPYVIKETT